SYPKGRGFDSLGSHFILLEVYPSLAEGIGLENRQAGNTARGFESLYLLHFYKLGNEKSINIILSRGGAVVARRAHNPKVAGSSPAPATKWSRGVAVNMPACHAGDRRFDPGRDRHLWVCSSVGRALD